MTDSFEEYVSQIKASLETKRRMPKGPLPAWILQLAAVPRVYAKQMSENFQISVRHGRVNQPGRPSHDWAAVDEGKAGDYLVLLGDEQLAVPRAMFERMFARKSSSRAKGRNE